MNTKKILRIFILIQIISWPKSALTMQKKKNKPQSIFMRSLLKTVVKKEEKPLKEKPKPNEWLNKNDCKKIYYQYRIFKFDEELKGEWEDSDNDD